jgi:bifunctional UDP-N-acetylglucosamine pyrophosphorylase/glucosamine-1-phosphate N-acetyltransferase
MVLFTTNVRLNGPMTQQALAVVVLAAGQGTRMKSDKAKVLHELSGIPLIGHVLATATAVEPDHIAVVIRHQRDAVAAAVTDFVEDAILVDQDDIPGTGRALELALESLPAEFHGDVVVISGDVPLLDSDTLLAVVEHHRLQGSALTLLSTLPEDPTGYGRVVRSDTGDVLKVVEHHDATDAERTIPEVNAGVYIAKKSEALSLLSQLGTTNAQGEKYLTDIVEAFHQRGDRVDAVVVEDSWLLEGINDRAQLSDVQARLTRMTVRGWQLSGVTIVDPASTMIDLQVELAPDVTLLPGVQLLGDTRIDAHATIGPDSTLVDTTVESHAQVVRTHSVGAHIREHASVGPFSYLRPGAVVGPEGKVGAFVEIKNSTLGRGAKVPHLSYIGDADIGPGTNIGAGAITANYDGANKHRTVIGAEVRTGSHTVFVAPVELGDGSYTAAGSIVRRRVEPGALAMSVASQRNLEGWVEHNREGSPAAIAAQKTRESKK